MTDAAVQEPSSTVSPQSEVIALPPAHIRMLLIGLGLATGMEFYTFDSMNLVLADLTGTLPPAERMT